jgi:hypothetical protein
LERELLDRAHVQRSSAEIVPLRSMRSFLWGEDVAP